MFNKLGLVDFHSWVKKIVNEAYYRIYLRTERSLVFVNSIELCYAAMEDDYELPLVYVNITFLDSVCDEQLSLDVVLDLNSTDEFNIGVVYSAIINLEDN